VAVAFLVALFKARPSPFYILDEVEAALDDANINRFLELVRRFSDRTQFVIVTHQKLTMDAADVLYGVSMGGDGVTKVEIANSEFGLKYRMLRQEPKARFLLYKDGPEPPMPENWLLDVQLASAVFRADQAAIWVADLGIPAKYEAAVRDHLQELGDLRPRVD